MANTVATPDPPQSPSLQHHPRPSSRLVWSDSLNCQRNCTVSTMQFLIPVDHHAAHLVPHFHLAFPSSQGRGRGRGGRDAGRGRPRQGSGDVAKLGNNSFRYDNIMVVGNKYQDVDYDGLLDAINFSGDYSTLEYGIDGGDFQYDLFGMTTSNENSAKSNPSNYLHIDVAGLSKCLEQLPIHERLDLPMHVGKHLEDTYGGMRKKTLAELREDAKITSVPIKTSVAIAVDDLNSESVTENHTEKQR